MVPPFSIYSLHVYSSLDADAAATERTMAEASDPEVPGIPGPTMPPDAALSVYTLIGTWGRRVKW
jgi:hypothetical protein